MCFFKQMFCKVTRGHFLAPRTLAMVVTMIVYHTVAVSFFLTLFPRALLLALVWHSLFGLVVSNFYGNLTKDKKSVRSSA